MTTDDLVSTTKGVAALRAAFGSVPGYLNAATMGLPPRATVAALEAALVQWRTGTASAAGYDEAVRRSRAAYARLVGVPEGAVAVGSQVSVLAGLVAASLPDHAQVLTVAEDFTSVQFPFLAHRDRGVVVRQVPLTELAQQIRPGTSLVAFSLVQSADGRIADVHAVIAAAAQVGALTFCDTTQAVGWYPVSAGLFDVTACSAYKWLCAPRGSAFLTVRPGLLDRLRPMHAGWYAGESVWESVYGPQMRLSADARRFDVSPAWLCWVGTAPALELFASVDPSLVRAHDVALANRLRVAVGLAPDQTPVLAIDDPDEALLGRLTAAGCVVAGRAGRVRLAFHVWNDGDDVARAASALLG